MTLADDLHWRGLVKQTTSPALPVLLSQERLTLYCGFDPTADSLHIGSLLPLSLLRHLQRQGHRLIALLGGATGMIGDPSGRNEERTLLTRADIINNGKALRLLISKLLADASNPPLIVDNYEWFADVGYISFLRDIGKHFSVNAMIAKESVRLRLETREQGISYTEFSYALLQSYDFYQLYKRYDCRLQVGGSDQWGNITSGVELIRKLLHSEQDESKVSKPVYGLTFPLLTKSDGSKFGKTATGNIWLAPAKTSPYDFYQFFLRVSDEEALQLLKQLTLISKQEYLRLEKETQADPHLRRAQQRLADDLLCWVHGKDALAEVHVTTTAFFTKQELKTMSETELRARYAQTPCTTLARQDLLAGVDILQLLATCNLCVSRAQAKRDILAGGVYVNDERITDTCLRLRASHLLVDSFIVLRKGKKSHHLIRVTAESGT